MVREKAYIPGSGPGTPVPSSLWAPGRRATLARNEILQLVTVVLSDHALAERCKSYHRQSHRRKSKQSFPLEATFSHALLPIMTGSPPSTGKS